MSDRVYLDLLKITDEQDSLVPYINVNLERIKDALETYTRNLSASGLVWTDVPFLNGWVNYGGAYQNVQYAVDSNGFVFVRGVMSSGTLGSSAFNLPVGKRPLNTLIYSAPTANRVEIGSDGNVTPIAGTNTRVTLGFLTFAAEQ